MSYRKTSLHIVPSSLVISPRSLFLTAFSGNPIVFRQLAVPMETPLSSRRETRSQALAAIDDNENDSEKSARKRNVLIDITNDSPIAGVAMETPTSDIVKKRKRRAIRTPGSGEALLRCQVKSLLQKVEEEAEFSKISVGSRPVLSVKDIASYPIGLLAPSPVNTPEDRDGLSSALPSLVVEQLVSQVETEKFLITRSLLPDFFEKLEDSMDYVEVTSVMTYKGGSEENECTEKMSASDDDVSSMWSIQVNASEGEEDEVIEGEAMGEWEDGEYEGDLIDELCDGIHNVLMNGKMMAKFEGKHTRFVYNSDDEIIEEEEGCRG